MANHLIDVFRAISVHAEDWVLATVIETQGSTYRKAGAKMLISREGECVGLLSGAAWRAT
ncbi:XdhC family protein [Candidatus Methylomicrobium oryzae]|uniref:XdhC family protein n=1 Tax=Candidatus Methylomicrobium oryzae TaxID=2802053 RepID=UPI001F49291B|nr:XdhC family protein [Methylomicrobium sp. RS1]